MLHITIDINAHSKSNRKLDTCPSVDNETIDFSGQRVLSYVDIETTIITIDMVTMSVSLMYAKTTDCYKYISHTVYELKTDSFKNALRCAQDMKSVVLNKKMTEL